MYVCVPVTDSRKVAMSTLRSTRPITEFVLPAETSRLVWLDVSGMTMLTLTAELGPSGFPTISDAFGELDPGRTDMLLFDGE